MNENRNNGNTTFIKVIVLVVLLIVIIAILFLSGLIRFEKKSDKFVLTEQEWRELKEEVSLLRDEVNQLKQGEANSVAAPRQKGTATAPTDDIELSNYSHDLRSSRDAAVSFKNNTDKIVTSISGRIIYYDMSGNMLDYMDFTKDVTIDAGMAKTVSLKGYDTRHEYKVKFELKSYDSNDTVEDGFGI